MNEITEDGAMTIANDAHTAWTLKQCVCCDFGFPTRKEINIYIYISIHIEHIYIYILGSSCDHFGMTLGSIWNHLDITLVSFWGHFEIILGSCWDRFEITLQSFWDHIGIPLRLRMPKFALWWNTKLTVRDKPQICIGIRF